MERKGSFSFLLFVGSFVVGRLCLGKCLPVLSVLVVVVFFCRSLSGTMQVAGRRGGFWKAGLVAGCRLQARVDR